MKNVLRILDQRKQLNCGGYIVQTQSIVDNLNNVKREASRHFKGKKGGRNIWKLNEINSSKMKYIRALHGGN